MKPATSPDFTPQVEATPVAIPQGQKSVGSGRGMRASATMLGLALSVGTSGTALVGAGAAFGADATALTLLPATTEATPLPSVGSNRSATVSVAYHTVSAGETLWDIAQAHQVPVEAIKALNGLETSEDAEPKIQVGQVIKVPRASAPAVAPVATMERALPGPVAVPEPETPEPTALGATDLDGTERLVSAPGVAPATNPQNAEVKMAPEAPEAIAPESLAAVSEAVPPATAGTVPTLSPLPATAPPEASVPPTEIAPLPQLALGPRPAPDAYGLDTLESTESVPGAPPTPTQYQVQRGDTLAAIARRYGVSLAALVEANRIRNPNRLMVGRTLLIPGTTAVSPVAPAPALEATAPSPVQVAAASPVRVVPAPIAGASTSAAPAASAPVASAAAVEDPFVGNLLADVSAARAQAEVSAQTSVQAPGALDAPTLGASPEATSPAPILLASSPAIAEPRADGDDALTPGTPIASSPSTTEDVAQLSPSRQRELLAAAPLGSEAYAPINRTPVGQIVSPGMPMLPDTSEYLPDAPARFAGYVWPSQGVLTSGFGWRWGRRHQGIDIAGPVGTPIVAAADGVVERSGWNSGGYGNMVDIRHPDGSLTRYAHNHRNHVRVGQQVRQGQLIADMGSTGRSTGPHVHFEIHLPGSGPVNPVAHLPNR